MKNHKYKIGDIVIIKSIKWYRKNCDDRGLVSVRCSFTEPMHKYCGMKAKIKNFTIDGYFIDIDNDGWEWSDEMFEDIKKLRKRKLKKLSKC
jgi:hypothetical protein